MLIESIKKTLVGYDQWHPSILTRASRRGTEESQLLVSASINANSTVLMLTLHQHIIALSAPVARQGGESCSASPRCDKVVARGEKPFLQGPDRLVLAI